MWCFRMWGLKLIISSKPLTDISFRCEVLTPSVFEGQSTIIIKPQILKHHIPELLGDGNARRVGRKEARRTGALPRLFEKET